MINRNRVTWLFLLAFVYTTITLWSIHGDLSTTLANGASANWRQPILANALYPDPISMQQWHFDYAAIEHILAKVKFSKNSKLLLNPKLAENLAEAVASLPQNMNDRALQRMAFLVSMSLPYLPKEAEKLATLLISYYHLQYATHKAHSIEKDLLKTTDKLQAFLQKEALQNHYLGESVATQLFGKQRTITRYLLERKAIKENLNLTSQQKQHLLHALKNPLLRR